MKQYLDQLRYILDNGNKRDDRTGTGTIGVFGLQSRYDLSDGFPAVTTKKLFWKGVVYELLWMLKGDTNIKYLVDNGVHIWDDDAYRFFLNNYKLLDPPPMTKEEFIECIKDGPTDADNFIYGGIIGDLGPIYGKQWRDWDGIDQIANLIDGIKNNPYSRRHIINAWNVAEIDECALPPCHCMAQFYVCDGKLSCQMYQRSCDYGLGASFNIASYSLLTHMIAQVCDLGVGDFIHDVGDSHIYLDHIGKIKEQLKRKPYDLPTLLLNRDIKDIDDFKYSDIKLENYKSSPPIKLNLSVGV